MPNPSAGRFKRDMLTLERTYTTQAKSALDATRRRLLDALLSLGVASPSFPAAIRVETDTLARQVAVIGRDHAPIVQETAARLASGELRGVGLGAGFDGLAMATTAKRSEAAKLLESTAWVSALATRLAAETMRLRASEAVIEEAAEQLLNEDAGAWRAGIVGMQLESQLNLWTVGIGLAATYYAAAAAQTGQPLFKVAEAELDDDTTECCINVNGQIQPLDQPFETDGAPAFASLQMHPPFHWNCRTVEGLAREE